ncbi:MULTISPECIES: thioredoxin [unclassified Pseudomonas]|uniref:thioredoxin n=1 Tax=unclassified Pseudomonas TaxID=196821 RepID=UPI002447E297|nr:MULTISPECIES: thioredoxin [unclassified Pseudomonas]MDG9924184.1 thioredoxin [Pseudomonas sp. GD04045]MDH0036614.1 thioredoxin [Pseudomonas sp. GD04019]
MTTPDAIHLTSHVNSIVPSLELTDFDADRLLLDLPGSSLLIFTSIGCASCRWARRELPGMRLPVQRLCWVDAGHNAGLVQRYGVFHLPSLFLIHDGQFFGSLQSQLNSIGLSALLQQALGREPEELP